MRRALVLLLVAACGEKKIAPAPVVPVPVIATVVEKAPDAAPIEVVNATQPPPARRRLQLTLRSTPPGAAAMVDGRLVGNAPVRYEMNDDGHVHLFAFTLGGYAPWRLEFSPSRDGVIHAELRAAPGQPDGG